MVTILRGRSIKATTDVVFKLFKHSYYYSAGHPECDVTPRNPYYDPWHEESIHGETPRCRIARKNHVTMMNGIGVSPELMEIVRHIFSCANAPIVFEVHEMGEDADDDDLNALIYSVERNGVAIKGSIDIVPDTGETLRTYEIKKALDLYLRVVEIKSFPAVVEKTRLKTNVDAVFMRLNLEGVAAMLEHDNGVGIMNLRVTTEYNTRRLAEFAFNYAIKHSRRQVLLVYRKGIMTRAEGTIVEVAQAVAARHPEMPFQIQSMKAFVYKMKDFSFNGDVIITAPLDGGLILNILCGMMQACGVYSSQNLGPRYAVFEPSSRNKGYKMRGKNIVNPIAALKCGIDMLHYLGHHTTANTIERAIDLTVNEDRIHTRDMLGKHTTTDMVTNIERRIREVMPEGFRGEKPPPPKLPTQTGPYIPPPNYK